MKPIVIMLLATCATACVDGRNTHDGIELRLSSGMTARLAKSSSDKVRMTYMGRAIRYEEGSLYVDDQRLTLPEDARVVSFEGPNIYVDGRNIEAL